MTGILQATRWITLQITAVMVLSPFWPHCVSAFVLQPLGQLRAPMQSLPNCIVTRIRSSVDDADMTNDADNDDDEEQVEPGTMRVSEIKSELELRGIDYSDCFDRESLVGRLQEARATGKADPKILEQFNKQKLEQTFKEETFEIKREDLNQAVANDGTLPGGLSPDQFQKLATNPEIMTLLQSTKMQEAMSLMMTGGRDELEKKLRDDPELQETVAKLNSILGSIQ